MIILDMHVMATAPHNRRLQFGLRSLLIGVVVLAVLSLTATWEINGYSTWQQLKEADRILLRGGLTRNNLGTLP